MLKRALFILFLLIVFAISSLAINSPIKVGEQFPKLALKDIDGKEFVLESGKNPTLVLFFASWSTVCREELLFIKDLKPEGVDIIAVAFDKDKKVLKDYVSENKLPFTILQDTNLVSPQRYQILVIPTTYVLKSDGTIKNIFIDFDKNVGKSLSSSIKTLLKK